MVVGGNPSLRWIRLFELVALGQQQGGQFPVRGAGTVGGMHHDHTGELKGRGRFLSGGWRQFRGRWGGRKALRARRAGRQQQGKEQLFHTGKLPPLRGLGTLDSRVGILPYLFRKLSGNADYAKNSYSTSLTSWLLSSL